MDKYSKLWRIFFAVSLGAIAVQQIICGGFRPLILPPSPVWLASSIPSIWVGSILLLLASIIILFDIMTRQVAIYLGIIFLLMVIIFHLPYEIETDLHYFGGWSNALKLLAYSGGAFIVAASIPKTDLNDSGFTGSLARILPVGRFFFSITMIAFGIEHFVYAPYVAVLVPTWVPWATFWTYFAGVALIASGVAIIINVQLKLAAKLLGIMIFLWLLMLHIPRAIADPKSGAGNEWTSVFEALGFSGIAFLIAGNKSGRS